VTPKKENEQIRYSRELPFDSLDFVERNEKYHSIGTAFFINNQDLMTAAHVFGLEYFSLLQDFYIRDTNGKVYPVNQIKRYSTLRDMVVFDLKSYPAEIHPLSFNDEIAVGDTVFSVGNAQGEGIAYRAGQVASFTPEREYGKWKDIRFTSPASPGNSGGPLLNIKGEAVGLIVKKNQSENYNISVPVKELENLTNQAEFHLRNLRMGLVGVDDSLSRDWSFSCQLPATFDDVASEAQESLNSHMKKLGDDLMEMVQDKNFPRGIRFRSFLRDQPYVKGFALLLPETNFNKWRIKRSYQEKIPLTAKQNIYRGSGVASDLHVIIEKPENTTLETFIGSPAMVMENLLKGVSFTRPVGRENIPVKSFGEPESTEVILDQLGRKWISSIWNLPYSDSFVHSSCLPYPKGVICNIDNKGSGYRKYGYFHDVQDSYDEIIVGYSGETGDWIEYFSLDKKHLPEIFQNTSVDLNEKTLAVKFNNFSFELSHENLTSTSEIHFHLGYSNTKLLAEDLLLFEVFPEKGSKSHYRIQPFYQPDDFSTDTYKSKWQDIIESTGEYSGRKVNKGEKVFVKKAILNTKKTLRLYDDSELQRIFVAGCQYKTTDVEVESDCKRFLEALSF